MVEVFRKWAALALFVPVFCATPVIAAKSVDAPALYREHCASCHGVDRLGGNGPALLPENLKRLRRSRAARVILDGRPATQMPAYAGKITEKQASALVELVYTPLEKTPVWGEAEIKATHILNISKTPLSDTPVFNADPLSLFIVVEAGDHHVNILDGDTFRSIHRFPSRFALHGGPKFSPDGRYVYFASRDGWISKFDIYNLKTVAEVRAGINTRNLAVSGDGRYVIVGNYLPHNLAIFDAKDLGLIKVIATEDQKGKSSRVSAVYDAAPRKSFIVALKDITEVWEIPYTDDHEPIYPGLVHDYRMGEGLALKGPFPVRRILLDDYLDDFFFDQNYDHLIGAARNNKQGQVVSLLAGRKIASIDLPGLPHLGSGITWNYKGTTVLATPNLKAGEISIIDMRNWKTIKRLKTEGPGFFMRSHENSRYAWSDVFFGPHKDLINIIDKRTLKIIKTLRPSPGKTSGHVEFTRDGRYVLLSIWEMDGELVIYDSKTLKEIKRIPMKKPSGKYNVYNKITRSSGTSH